MSFKRPPLPFKIDDLAPFVSKEQMDYHYNKHHEAYFKKLNTMVEGKKEETLPLEEIVKTSEGGLFNNSAQAWNHTFFWHCLSPSGGGKPTENLLLEIEKHFGSFDAFKEKFSSAAATLFGSGWAWLAKKHDGSLSIMPLKDADTPLKYDATPLLTLDVWEHAYYIDYRNRRPDFIEGFWDVVNWDFASKNLALS